MVEKGYKIRWNTLSLGLLWMLFARETKSRETSESMAIIDVFRNLGNLRNVRIVLAMGLLAILTALNIILVMKISGMALYIGLAVLGFISAPFMALLLVILMDSPGVETRYMGSAGGMFYCVAEIGGFAGPFFMGVLVDLTGTFMAGAVFLAGLCIAIAVLTRFLKQGAP